MADRKPLSTHQPAGPLNVLLVGGGGREHALAWKLRQSQRLGNLYLTHPENPGLDPIGTPIDIPVDYKHPFRLERFCIKHHVGLVIIGPEEPLAMGLADALTAANIPVFGPTKDAARLEADKAWCKQLLRAAAIPAAEGRTFTEPDAAISFLESRESPYVVKASGLAAGKGVVVPASLDEARAAVRHIMIDRRFGDAGKTIVIEERLTGRETSLFALVDGRNIYILETCRDHKRLGDNDTGPNTGGMGVVSPADDLDDDAIARIQREILIPVVDTLKREGIEFQGVLFAGLMLTPAGPKVLEFNVRFGDPECQALMRRLRGDLVEICHAVATRRLDTVELDWDPRHACAVVLASRGYPEKPETGAVITGVEDAEKLPDIVVFHSGTRRNDNGQLVTAGGRVLTVTALGNSPEDARSRAYQAADLIHFEGKTLRRDIGLTPSPAPHRSRTAARPA